jgi:hypothetical protein
MLTDRLRSRFISVLLVLLLLPAVLAFDCRLDLPSSNGKKGKDVHFDLGPLDGEYSASKTTQTPPTTNEAKVRLRLCGDEGLKRDTEMADEDQVRSSFSMLLGDQLASNLIMTLGTVSGWDESLLDPPQPQIVVVGRSSSDGRDTDLVNRHGRGCYQGVD